MKLTQEQLEVIRQRTENATPGPWKIASTTDGDYVLDTDDMIIAATIERTEDATFIAHARTDIPALLEHIAELEAELAYMNGVVGTLLSSLSLIEEQVEGNTLLLVQEAIKYAKEAES